MNDLQDDLVMQVVFPVLHTYAIPFDAVREGNHLELSGSYLVRMAGLQSGEGRMMIDSVDWAQYINGTDTDSHVAIVLRWAAKIKECVVKTELITKFQC